MWAAGRHAVRWPRLACLWLCLHSCARPWAAAGEPAEAGAAAGSGGTLRSAAAKLLSLSAPELRHPSEPFASAQLDARGESTAFLTSGADVQILAAPDLRQLTEPDPRHNATDLLTSGPGTEAVVIPAAYHYTDSTACFGIYMTLYVVYAVLCWWYELRELRRAERLAEAEAAEPRKRRPEAELSVEASPAAQTAPAARQRYVEWDLVKAVMLFFVILLHVGRNGWKRGGLSNGEQTFFLMLAPFPMPIFAFVSGVFGASVERASLMKTLCYTLGTFFLAKEMGGAIILLTPGPKSVEDLRCVGYLVFWYLKALFVWRFLLSPLFHFAKKRSVPAPATFAAVFAACYFLRHMGLPHWAHEWIYFAPYYAQGLLLAPARWSELLADRRCFWVAVAFLVAWCSSLLLIPGSRDWNDVACARGFAQCPNSHWPASVSFERRPVSLDSFMDDLHTYVLQDGLSMAVMWVVAACALPLQALAPRLAAVLFGCGSRTLYGYVLHFMLFLHFGLRMGVSFPPMPGWLWAVVCLPLAFQALLIFCSSFTERLFSWVIMPFWLLGLCDQPKVW